MGSSNEEWTSWKADRSPFSLESSGKFATRPNEKEETIDLSSGVSKYKWTICPSNTRVAPVLNCTLCIRFALCCIRTFRDLKAHRLHSLFFYLYAHSSHYIVRYPARPSPKFLGLISLSLSRLYDFHEAASFSPRARQFVRLRVHTALTRV